MTETVGFDPQTRPNFALKFQDEVSPHRLMTTTVMPSESISLEAIFTRRGTRFEAVDKKMGGQLERMGPERWKWTAPAVPGGPHCIRVLDQETKDTIALQVFVRVPYAGEDILEGYRIGSYQEVPLNNDPGYGVPSGFVRVTDILSDIWVSPHFQLKQFVAKQASSDPKFVALQSRLLLKLELVLERAREEGLKASTFAILSGYRTPHYNASIGNRTKYSRHTYGDAADIFIDEDRDGRMDDLDGDGQVTAADARVLFDLVNRLYGETWYSPFVGGLGLYGPKPHRGPFIHVDTRGNKARW